jgi:hypothetical protein
MALRVLEGKPLSAKSVDVYQRSERAVKYALLSELRTVDRRHRVVRRQSTGLCFHPVRPLTLMQGSTSLIGQPFHE